MSSPHGSCDSFVIQSNQVIRRTKIASKKKRKKQQIQ